MKTNVILQSRSRDLFGIKIRQETKTNHLCVTDLQDAYAAARIQFDWAERGRPNDIISQKENSERIYYVLKETGKINTDFPVFMSQVAESGMIKVLKKIGAYKAIGARENKTVWCDPYLWVLLAMELNPMLYGKTVVWLTDQLVFNRIESGDMYKGLSKAVKKFPDTNYSDLAKSLNHVVFKRHETLLRNQATKEELEELHKLESNLAFSVDCGFIKSFPDLMEEIRNIWRRKYNSPSYIS